MLEHLRCSRGSPMRRNRVPMSDPGITDAISRYR
jgi:hypothetical protein